MKINTAKYIKDAKTNENIAVWANIDGENIGVPMDTANRHYAEILKQVADGDITIAEAD